METEPAVTAAVVATATLSNGVGSENGTGGDRGHALDVGPSVEGAVPSKAPRKRIAEIERERRRLRRKDVYSYFIMPLVRALEAQMGTTAWLRKVRCLSRLTLWFARALIGRSFIVKSWLSACLL